MVSNAILIGTAVGLFVAGLGVSYAIFSDSSNPTMRFSNQQMFDQMMSQNPKMHAQWMGSMMQDPQQMEQMQQLMLNPEFREQMFQQMNTMMNDPELQQQMMQQMGTMMNDPQMRQQMMGTMMQNQDLMQDMMNNNQMMGMMGSGMMGGSMGQGMMGPNMMLQNWNYDPQTTPSMMMTDPELRQQMFDQMGIHHQYVLDTLLLTIEDEQTKADLMELMNEHSRLIGEMQTSYFDDPEIQQRIHDHIAQHYQFLQKLNADAPNTITPHWRV